MNSHDWSSSDPAIESWCEMVPDHIQMDRRTDLMAFTHISDTMVHLKMLGQVIFPIIRHYRTDKRVILFLFLNFLYKFKIPE